MSIETSMKEISKKLIRSFAVLDGWFDQPDYILYQQPAKNETQAADILNHVILVNEALLERLEKVSVADFADLDVQQVLKPIEGEITSTFVHTTQVNHDSLVTVRKNLRSQLHRCLCLIDILSDNREASDDESSARAKLYIHQNLWHMSTFIEGHLSQLNVFRRAHSDAITT